MNDRFKLLDKYYETEVVKSSKNGNWKGGTYICGGYIKVKVKSHPMADKRNYVLLHRLVMENHLGRYLREDEYIHHKDGNKMNNDISNLELVYPEQHAKEHYIMRNIDETTGRFLCSDPKLNDIKIRLYDKDRQCTKEYSLSKLIYTKFKRNKFEYRGMSTGLKDKNGNLIYEGDILDCELQNIDSHGYPFIHFKKGVVKRGKNGVYCVEGDDDFYASDITLYPIEIIGNIHENKGE